MMHNHVAYRSFFPKTSVPKATLEHPVTFHRLDETFQWATKFLQRLSEKLGPEIVCKKLSSWRWLLSTCFSGIGCPELVLSSDRNCKLSKQQCPLVLVCEFWTEINLEAVLSLQAAAHKFLARHSKKKPGLNAQKVVLASSCEINGDCQKVLKATFGQDSNHCLFPDILKLGDGCERAFCVAHNKKCCTLKPCAPSRNSSCIQDGCLSSVSKEIKLRYYNWWLALTKTLCDQGIPINVSGLCLRSKSCKILSLCCRASQCKASSLCHERCLHQGPVCIGWSNMGKRLQKDDMSYKTHQAYYCTLLLVYYIIEFSLHQSEN